MTEPGADLPQPARARWQPLRIGLVELYRYDSEEFWFRDGHLLLRGNNGTGKSKVLSLTLPLLLDANLRSSRVEPDGDAGKKMAWNLLLGDAYERRTGYSWIEFGRLAADGSAQFISLGMGLYAVAARSQVESWFFVVEGTSRINAALWLMSPQRQVHGRDKLREALAANGATQGQVFDQAQAYRRSVDERLFGLGPRRYDALVDTLIQLRQPQLSRRPDERALSSALTESLPPLPQELLADVAEAMTQLEEQRRELESTQRLADAVQRFDQRYRIYAGMASRRQARTLRQAQTEVDHASRDRHGAQAELSAAQAREQATQARCDNAAAMLAGARERHETLLSDPLNSEANRLDQAERDARHAEQAVEGDEKEQRDALVLAGREAAQLDITERRAQAAVAALQQTRQSALALARALGIGGELALHPYVAAEPGALADSAVAGRDEMRSALHRLPAQRREHLALVRRRVASQAAAEQELRLHRLALAERAAEAEDAAGALALAEERAQALALAHEQSWSDHLDSLRELQVDAAAVLSALAAWVLQPQGEHPARSALHAAQGPALQVLAAQRHAVEHAAGLLGAERQQLREEGAALRAGVDRQPPAAAWRGDGTRVGRAGAPLWQLVDFVPSLAAAERAGLEAALLAAGVLDAWVTPDGRLLYGDDGRPWLDAQWLARAAPGRATLARCLVADVAEGAAVPPSRVTALLESMACGEHDSVEAEAWVATDGRYRLAGLTGAAAQPRAQYIGHAARLAARQQRLAGIDDRLAEIAVEDAALTARRNGLDDRSARVAAEWQRAPTDQALRQAHETVAARLRQLDPARQRVAEAESRWRSADQAARAAGEQLQRDAGDLRLPVEAEALDRLDLTLHDLADALHGLAGAVRDVVAVTPELALQRQREAQARQQLLTRTQRLGASRVVAEQARSRLAALMSAVGVEVEGLRRRIDRARALVLRIEAARERLTTELRAAAEARARAAQRSETAEAALTQRLAERAERIDRLRQFTATGLLASGLAGSAAPPELPDTSLPWTIDPALTLARRVEQLLSGLDDGDERWKRAQQQVTEDLAELQRTLSALGHQAPAQTTDFGFVVQVLWHHRQERPETLLAILNADLAARHALLSAREREVLENHLQAEIATQIQGLMRAASRQVQAINAELQRRPTSTGVRFRLQWQALPEGAGAPAGFLAARERLLNSSAELWTADDRRVLGSLLQQRIVDERLGAAAALDAGGSLLEQLARALDYRQWHQFRVERLQDGQWRKLSGPASSGERALGLTVPLFAAVASFYQASPLAPRLMLLDEAFAGIDDAARAHCMALVREFDLDFVITSEREWGCYAELPGVAIAQLQRREGIDAVHVSRWTWDGRARRRESDPGLRFPPPAA